MGADRESAGRQMSKRKNPLVMAVGDLVREARERAGLSQDALAAKTSGNIHSNTISNIERGVVALRIDTLAEIAAAVGIDVTELMPRKTAPNKPLVDRYLKSPWAAIDNPTTEEVDWLLHGGTIETLGAEPDEETCHELLSQRRRLLQRSH